MDSLFKIDFRANFDYRTSSTNQAGLQTLYFFSLEIVERGYESKTRGGFIAPKGNGLRFLLSFFFSRLGLVLEE